ncbi:MAG: type II toxin-antitoxin system prevent-host-death family antitoxin [SAR324 cluster bacterium]|uniref:Antitoxin n=1 Tax=SAR324 cluster bacterium TaxID=2024889 RepID=A0A2A4T208_9DELT|nr:MAG: type II toxin-antitoxin system prevent-host-death family antitoxin [SAR324 cluster bacterium]
MPSLSVSEARKNLYRLVDEVTESHVPVLITGKRNSAVLISEGDWSSIQETLHLISIPGMKESIQEGQSTPIGDCSEELDW